MNWSPSLAIMKVKSEFVAGPVASDAQLRGGCRLELLLGSTFANWGSWKDGIAAC